MHLRSGVGAYSFIENFMKGAQLMPLRFIPQGLFLCHDLAMSYVYTNPNPCNRTVGDCAVRAVAIALDLTWQDAFLKIVTEAYGQCDMPSSDAVWGAVLQHHGFTRKMIPNTCPPCYTAERFCEDNPEGVFVLGFGGHTAAVIDGNLMDAWNSSNEIPIYVWYQPHKER